MIHEIVDVTVWQHIAQLRAGLRSALQHEVIEPIKTVSRNSDDRLASLIVRTVRDTGILRRLLFTLIAKISGVEFAQQASADARSGLDLAPHVPATRAMYRIIEL